MFRILDEKTTEVRYNSEWLGKLGYVGLIGLSAKVTLSQMLDRKEFLTRFHAEQDISFTNFFIRWCRATIPLPWSATSNSAARTRNSTFDGP